MNTIYTLEYNALDERLIVYMASIRTFTTVKLLTNSKWSLQWWLYCRGSTKWLFALNGYLHVYISLYSVFCHISIVNFISVYCKYQIKNVTFIEWKKINVIFNFIKFWSFIIWLDWFMISEQIKGQATQALVSVIKGYPIV